MYGEISPEILMVASEAISMNHDNSVISIYLFIYTIFFGEGESRLHQSKRLVCVCVPKMMYTFNMFTNLVHKLKLRMGSMQ